MTRLDELADAVGALIAAAAGDSAAVEVADVPDVDVERLRAGERRVFVTAARYADGGPVSRAEDRTLYTVLVVAVERYAEREAGVPLAWRRERSGWFRETVFDRLNDPRARVGGMVPESSGEVEFDKALLVEQKLWWEWVEVTFREDA